jgi:hypothetical protein
MAADFRVDAVVEAARAVPRAPSGHRGSTELRLSDADLRTVVDALVSAGRFSRRGHRVRLADHQPTLERADRERVEQLLSGLREAGFAPPRVDGIAARLGITPPLLVQLRRSGQLVAVAPGIDYPADVWQEITRRLDRLSGPMNVARVRDELRTSRRHAEAILSLRRAERRGQARRLRPGRRGG